MHMRVQVRDRAERDKLERERAARERADRREKEAAEQARLKAEREARAAQLRRERIMMERLTKQQVRWLWACQSKATSHAGSPLCRLWVSHPSQRLPCMSVELSV